MRASFKQIQSDELVRDTQWTGRDVTGLCVANLKDFFLFETRSVARESFFGSPVRSALASVLSCILKFWTKMRGIIVMV